MPVMLTQAKARSQRLWPGHQSVPNRAQDEVLTNIDQPRRSVRARLPESPVSRELPLVCCVSKGGPMFLTIGIVAMLAALKFAVGFIMGDGTAKAIYRSRVTTARTIRAFISAGIVYVLISGFAGWAGSHAAFENGRRLDVAPWGEDLRLRNAIAGNEILLCLTASIGTAVLANFRTRDETR